MASLIFWPWMQLVYPRKVRGNDRIKTSAASFLSATSSSQKDIQTDFRVKKGPGMGMKNSGELSDAALANLVETWCLLS